MLWEKSNLKKLPNHTCMKVRSEITNTCHFQAFIFKTTMADPDTLIKAKVHYFAREKYYHSMQVIIN